MIEDRLQGLARLARIMVDERISESSRDDAYQEAMIAAWQAIEKGKPQGLVIADMREAVINVFRGRSMTGSKRPPGINGVDTHHRYGTPLVRTNSEGEEYMVIEPVVESAEELALRDQAALAIVSALEDLEELDRGIAQLVGCEGLSATKTAELLGVTQKLVSRRWNLYIRGFLADRLAS